MSSLRPDVDVRADNAIITRMEPQKYQMIITWSDEDQAYLAEIPELPGCMADGKTRQEALANAENVIQEWIETAQDFSRSIPTPQGRLLTISESVLHRDWDSPDEDETWANL